MPGIGYGGDYNPEQWPEETWPEDVRLMAEAGVNLVTVGVFSWARLQPAPGPLSAGWMDRVLDLLHAAGVRVDLATATATPPPWLVAAYPEILPVTAEGHRLAPGARQHYCPSSPAYRDAAVDLVSRMAERYADHPAVVMWHVGNEYGCHVPSCYCDVSAAAFRTWLEARYGDVASLSSAWGGAVWSQDYTSFEQVGVPALAPTFRNPSQLLDFARFSSDELLACFLAEASVLRAQSSGKPVTTNFMGLFRPVDQFAWSRELDVTSVDSYPDPADPDSHLAAAMTDDLTRSVGGGIPWILMEQAPSAVNWRAINVVKAPGQYRTLSLQAVARGCDAVLSFQWRAAATGAEKFHSGMIPHAGTDSRIWREVVALGEELKRLSPVAGSLVSAEAAILFDWESWWALEEDSHPSSRLRLSELALELYRPLFEAGITTDFVRPVDDLSRYRLVLVPALYLLTDAGADNVARFVDAGGVALVTFFSGIVDATDRVRLGGYPAPWRELLGLRVEELAPLPEGATVRLEGVGSAATAGCATHWQDVISLSGASSLLHYAEGALAGSPAVTEHQYGRGTALYLGTWPDRATTSHLVQRACRRADLRLVASLPKGVEAVRRGDHLFVLNHLDQPVEIELVAKQMDILSGEMVGPRAILAPRGALVVSLEGIEDRAELLCWSR